LAIGERDLFIQGVSNGKGIWSLLQMVVAIMYLPVSVTRNADMKTDVILMRSISIYVLMLKQTGKPSETRNYFPFCLLLETSTEYHFTLVHLSAFATAKMAVYFCGAVG